MFPGGRKRGRETEKDCLKREIREELPELKLGRLRLWKEVKAKNRRSGRKMSDAIFVAKKTSGRLTIGDKKEIGKATWRKPRGIRLTPTSRYIRDKLFPKGKCGKMRLMRLSRAPTCAVIRLKGNFASRLFQFQLRNVQQAVLRKWTLPLSRLP
jgi:8-oxo-dGTP diphosphatase